VRRFFGLQAGMTTETARFPVSDMLDVARSLLIGHPQKHWKAFSERECLS